MEQKTFDVLIVGAGAAGLIAALEISLTGRAVALIEAKERVGGRIFTVHDRAFPVPVELGAEFVHGALPLTQQLLKKAGAETDAVEGSFWQYKDGQLRQQEDFIEDYHDLDKKFKQLSHDLPVAGFMQQYLQGEKYEELRFTLQNYVEGYYAANTHKASTFSLHQELSTSGDEQFRIRGGYQQLVSYLEQQCRQKGVAFFLSQPVWQLHWRTGEAEAITEKGNFSAPKALLTVPVGVWQNEGITFSPALPQKKEAAKMLGYGHVIKLLLQFEKPFWKDTSLTNGKNLDDLGFLFSQQAIPTWWTQHPREAALLTGWLGGPKAEALRLLGEEELTGKALHALGLIFGLDVGHLRQQLQQVQFYNWSADPFFQGAYSYEVVDGENYQKLLQQPVENTLFFAGEGLHHSPEIGTVEAALASGKNAAHHLIASFPG